MNADPKINSQTPPLERIHAQGTAMSDPKAFINHASVVLARLREDMIKAESMHLAKRNTEIVAFKDRLQKIDADHERLVAEMTAMIEKLEAFRG